MAFQNLIIFVLLLFFSIHMEAKNSKVYYSNFSESSENKLAYFREDLAINLNHWHWHLVNPVIGDEHLIKNDRRGELFYYYHQQVLARYNIERFCNDLNVTEPFDFDQVIDDGYFPMLTSEVASRTWFTRLPNSTVADVYRPEHNADIRVIDLKRYRDRIYEAIRRKKFRTADNRDIDIDNDQGINILGNTVEAAKILSPDFTYYGALHNLGHGLIAFLNDPKGLRNQGPGVMALSAVAMRDPIFYRWHTFINNVFSRHKDTFSPYTKEDLLFHDIQVTSINVVTSGLKVNVLETSMTKSTIKTTKGLDFSRQEKNLKPILFTWTHLTNSDFVYKIRVNNTSGGTLNGTVRIFMAPVKGHRNSKLTFYEQKNFMIEMDRFVVTLPPKNNILITRHSTESSVTVPYQQAFASLERSNVTNISGLKVDLPTVIRNATEHNYWCGCGLPQHVLLPSGTPEGYPMVLFVMISDYRVDDAGQSNQVQSDSTGSDDCKPSMSLCGLRGRLYPDRRPTGYPFDRPVDENMTLQEFTDLYDNMDVTQVQIRHIAEN